jgi:hypothetical protein
VGGASLGLLLAFERYSVERQVLRQEEEERGDGSAGRGLPVFRAPGGLAVNRLQAADGQRVVVVLVGRKLFAQDDGVEDVLLRPLRRHLPAQLLVPERLGVSDAEQLGLITRDALADALQYPRQLLVNRRRGRLLRTRPRGRAEQEREAEQHQSHPASLIHKTEVMSDE